MYSSLYLAIWSGDFNLWFLCNKWVQGKRFRIGLNLWLHVLAGGMPYRKNFAGHTEKFTFAPDFMMFF
jgi:hypothetical protein